MYGVEDKMWKNLPFITKIIAIVSYLRKKQKWLTQIGFLPESVALDFFKKLRTVFISLPS